MDASRHGKTILHFVVDDGVPTDDERAGFVHLVLPAAQDLAEDGDVQLVDGPADDVHRGQRLAAHGVDVGERVGRGDLSEAIRVIDDRREEIDRLDEGEIIGQHEDAGVIVGLATDDEPGIGAHGKCAQRAREVARTQLGGSTRAAGERRETKQLVSRVRAR